ncbi:type II toxin-antitoxin system VapC family toxin [Sphingomonas sp. LM7]|uniref:type II toxin-antitoxin system VapC family toxin n=1 Tax=Sphingomonas sp. LM7 TaxID=1938607 RepID=UPI000983C0C8|nr:type II toxin-antitoxin system VapC family toxin [Sphingomonas sp. LM7]AQR72969.1 VapC toxin family PIN domain ribonuclease [Sphingomonas sp. LM7]
MYLLDTPIVFELRKARSGDTDTGFVAWAAEVPRERLFLSAISLVELEATVAQTVRRDKAAGAALRSWIDDQVVPAFDGHILALDAAVARRRGQLALAETRDALFAATALEHGLTLVTRNAAAFKGARVKLFDPWGYEPSALDEDGDWRAAGRSGPLWLRNLFVRA